MRAPASQVLREAARDQHPNESFEKSLSRTVKKHQGTYADYIELIGKVRGRAERDHATLADAARSLATDAGA